MANKWEDAKVEAKKLLGKEGKVPKLRVDPSSLAPELNRIWDAFNKARSEVEAKLLDLQDGYSKAKNAAKQCGDVIDGDDFGLNQDDPKDKKRIAEVTKVLLDGLSDIEGVCDSYVSELGKLDTLISNLRKLKELKI